MDEKKRPFGLRDKIGYMFGDFANDFTFQFASSYLLIFYTKVLGISSGIVGTIFLLARLVDGFTDVGVGRLCDTAKAGKNGRFRVWIKWMAIPVSIASVLMYNAWIEPLSMAAKLAYVIVTYVLWGSICYTAINIPYGSMASVISPKAEERASLSTYRSIGAVLAGLFVGLLAPMLVYTKNESGVDVVNASGFMLAAVVFAVLAIICYYICYWCCTERVKLKPANGKKESHLFHDLRDLAKDRAFLSVILTALLGLVAMQANAALNQYLFLDYFGNTDALPLLNLISMGGMFLVAPASGWITKKFGKKEAGAVSLLVTGAVYLAIFFLHISNLWVYLGIQFLGYVFFGYYTMISWAYLTDIIDNHQVLTGKRKDGTVYAVYSFSRKLGQAIAGGIGGWTLWMIGYQESAVMQTPEVKNSIFTVSMLLPAVCYLVSGVLIWMMYPLTKAKVAENEAEVKRMMQ